MSEQKFWFLRLGKKEEPQYEHAAFRYSVISIGFDIVNDLTGMDTFDKIKKATPYGHGQINKFVNKIKKGDLVLSQLRSLNEDREDYYYMIGLIVDDYKPVQSISKTKYINRDGKREKDMRPARSVVWVAKGLREADFGDTLSYIAEGKGAYSKAVIKIKEDDEKGQKLIEQIYKVLTQKN